MTIEIVTQELKAAFIGGWENTTPIIFTNETYTIEPERSIVLFSIEITNSVQDTQGAVGERRYRNTGRAVVRIYTDRNTGSSESDTLVQRASNIFQGRQIGLSTFTESTIDPGNIFLNSSFEKIARFEFYFFTVR